jgi:predicted  nucleic acid-binding Zn-ribbon protein
MDKTITDLEKNLGTLHEMFKKYAQVSQQYQKQISDSNISEEKKAELLEKLKAENEKVQRAKMQIQQLEMNLEALKESRTKVNSVITAENERKTEDTAYLVAYC